MKQCGLLVLVFAMIAGAQAQVPVATVIDKEQATLLQNKDARLARNKRLVFDYWRVVIQAGRMDKVADYIDTNYISNDSAIAPGRQGLIGFLSPRPNKGAVDANVRNLVNIVAENDLVLLQTLNAFNDPERPEVQYSCVDHDVFRIRSGKIVEQWSSPRMTAEMILAAQAARSRPPITRSGGGAGRAARPAAVPFAEQTKLLASRNPQLAQNKRVAFDYWRTVVESGRFDLAARYMDAGYIQHNPGIPSGRQALIDFLSPRIKPRPTISQGIENLLQVIAERDIVALMQAGRDGGETVAFDVLRVEDGKIAEHWDSARFAADVAMTSRNQPGIQPAVPPPTLEEMEGNGLPNLVTPQ